MLVVLVGIDGAGKSTVARLFRDRAARTGRPALVLQNYSGRRTVSTWCTAHHVRLSAVLADAIETAIRLGHVLVSHLRARRFEGVVLMDRHLYCQLALRSVRGLPRGRLLPWVLRQLPPPDLVVFFDVSPDRALARIRRRGTDQESLAFLTAFSAAYRALPESAGFVPIPANGSATETGEALAELLADHPVDGGVRAPSTA